MKKGNSATTAIRDLRQWLERLGATGRLAVIRDNVPLKHRLAAIAKRLDGKQAAFFPKPGGHAIPVISGFIPTFSSVRQVKPLRRPRKPLESTPRISRRFLIFV